jgi:hypothetical protein
MQEPQTWRELLGTIVNDAAERQRIAQVLGVNPVTLTRWAMGVSHPRQDTLRRLLDALPEQREQFITLLSREYEQWSDTPAPEVARNNGIVMIPVEFYRHVLGVSCSIPSIMRSSTIQNLILQQIVDQLAVDETGLSVFIALCVPPGEDHEVRSLRVIGERGSAPWSQHVEQRTMFLGAESLTGYTAINAYMVTVQDHDNDLYWPSTEGNIERSSVACPILRANSIAGCLTIVCTQPHYFTPGLLSLVGDYVALLNLAFEESDFYALEKVALGVLPPYQVQRPILATFQAHVVQRLIETMQIGQPMNRPEAERIIWKQLEQELLKLPFHHQTAKKGEISSSS